MFFPDVYWYIFKNVIAHENVAAVGLAARKTYSASGHDGMLI